VLFPFGSLHFTSLCLSFQHLTFALSIPSVSHASIAFTMGKVAKIKFKVRKLLAKIKVRRLLAKDAKATDVTHEERLSQVHRV
jgi:hypothetical protein